MELGGANDDWETLGREDPLWAVYVAPGTRDGGWELDDFLSTGRSEVERCCLGCRSSRRQRAANGRSTSAAASAGSASPSARTSPA